MLADTRPIDLISPRQKELFLERAEYSILPMRKPTEQDLIAIFTRAPFELSVLVENGTLEMPLHIVITDGNDELISEFELSRDAAGKVTDKSLAAAKSLDSFVFPITYTAVSSNGKEWEAVFSEEGANELRRTH
jgi:hypothetical protein